MSRNKKQILLHVLLPLVAGFLIYYFFRADFWFEKYLTKREPLIPLGEANGFQKLFIFSGPDFCWAYSLSSALFIWHLWQGRTNKYFPLLILLLLVLSELAQVLLTPDFTVDWFDVLAAILAFVLSYILIYRNVKN